MMGVESRGYGSDCVEPLDFPKSIHNRPGLSSISYRIGSYFNFRDFFLRSLNSSHILSAWTNRGSDDPGIALLEGASIICDILTFYQELYANETKLRTAKWKESIADLVRLVDYRLSPGIAGKATFALEIKGTKPMIIKTGFRIKAELEGITQPLEFESEKDIVVYPWLSKFHLYRGLETCKITREIKEFYISWSDPNSSHVTIREGDRLLIGDRDPNDSNDPLSPARLLNAEIVVIDKVGELLGHKLFKIKGSLMKQNGSNEEVIAYKLGRSFRHFGHSSPQKIMVVDGRNVIEKTVSYKRWIDQHTVEEELQNEKRILDPILFAEHFPLDNSIDNISPGTTFLIQNSPRPTNPDLVTDLNTPVVEPIFQGGKKNYQLTQASQTFVRTIKEVRSISMTWGSITGETSLIILDKRLKVEGIPFNAVDIRYIEFHEAGSPLFKLRAKDKETSETKGKILNFYGTDKEAEALHGRGLLFESTGKPLFAANVVEVELPTISPSSPSLHKITIDKEVESYADYPHEKHIVRVYGNLIDANQGKTEKEVILGNGDSRQIFQTFRLPKSPLTYRIIAGETPPEVPQLEIYVNDQLWRRVSSFFDRNSKEKIYIVRQDVSGDSWVQFGDGKTGGARLPSGIKNVVAKFRTGIGAYGHLKAETIVQPGERIENLDKIHLLDVVSGGSPSESGENARQAAPGKIQSLGRLVSVPDIENEALSIAGVSKASARWGLEDNVPVTIVRVLMDSGREEEFVEVEKILKDYDKKRGMQRFPIIVRQSNLQYVYVTLDYGYESTFRKEQIEKSIKEVLGVVGEGNVNGSNGLFGIHHRKFGEREYLTRIEGVIQYVPGIVWVKVKAIGSLSLIRNPLSVIMCDEDNILALDTKNLHMTGSKVELMEGH